MESEVGAVVEGDQILDQPDLENPSLHDLPFPPERDLVGCVVERAEVFDHAVGSEKLQEKRLPRKKSPLQGEKSGELGVVQLDATELVPPEQRVAERQIPDKK